MRRRLFTVAILPFLAGCIVQPIVRAPQVQTHLNGRLESWRASNNSPEIRGPSFKQKAELGISQISVHKNNLWAVGHKRKPDGSETESLILHSSDGGRFFEKQMVDSAHYFFDVCFANKNDGWVCGADGLILRSTDGGATWAKQLPSTDSTLVEVQFISSDVGWVLAEDGEVLRTADSGLHWSASRLKMNGSVGLLSFSDKSKGWVVGERSQAHQSTDGGVSWKSRGLEFIALVDKTQRHEADFRAVEFLDSRVGFIAGIVRPRREFEKESNVFRKGVVFKTEDGGSSWRVLSAIDGLELLSAAFLSEKEGWIVTMHDPGLIHTQDGAKTWTSETNLSRYGPVRVFFADSKSGWAETGWGFSVHYLLYTIDGGKTWSRSKLPDD
jgi:photosystem II stability/assembly factor-like uncharacterized protein